MQQDYPLYEEMVRRGSRGRWFWRIGSRLYCTGLDIAKYLQGPEAASKEN